MSQYCITLYGPSADPDVTQAYRSFAVHGSRFYAERVARDERYRYLHDLGIRLEYDVERVPSCRFVEELRYDYPV